MNGEAKAPLPLKDIAMRFLLGGGGAGAGLGLVYVLLEIHRSDPKLIGELLRSWGPLSLLLGMVLFFGYRQNERGIRVQQEVASSQRELVGQMQTTVSSLSNGVQVQAVSMRDMSEAMHRLANKDNETLLRLEAQIEESCDRTKRIVGWIEEQEARRLQQERNSNDAHR